jgi:hypothetical protein
VTADEVEELDVSVLRSDGDEEVRSMIHERGAVGVLQRRKRRLMRRDGLKAMIGIQFVSHRDIYSQSNSLLSA